MLNTKLPPLFIIRRLFLSAIVVETVSGLIPRHPVVLSCLDHKVSVLVFVSTGELCH